MLKTGNLKILTKSTTTKVVQETTHHQADTKLMKLEQTYNKASTGSISEMDVKKTLLRIHPKLLKDIETETRNNANIVIKNLISWYIDIKKILLNMDSPLLAKDFKKFKTIHNNLDKFLKSTRFDKNQSLLVKDLLSEIFNDDPIKPKYLISEELVKFLAKTNRTSSFIKEITLCVGLYKKYIKTLADDYNKQVTNDQKIISFKKMDDVQPRFNMIMNHISSSTPTKGLKRDFNLSSIGDLKEINKDLTVDQEISSLGTRKRLIEINTWLNNGIIQAQYSFNRLNNLKITRGPKNVNKNYLGTIDTNYKVWKLLKDMESFLGSLEDLLMGKSFILGVTSKDSLDVLDVNY